MKWFPFITVAAIFCLPAAVCARFNIVTRTKVYRKTVPKTTQSAISEQLPPYSPYQQRDSPVFASLQTQAEQTDRHMVLVSPLHHISITSPFGYHRDPSTKRKALHSGSDSKANYKLIYATMHGEVIKTGKGKRLGLYVTLRCGDFTVSYCHLSRTLVTKGIHVCPDVIIALTGSSGRNISPHLHLTPKDTKKGRTIDPSILPNLIKHLP